MFSSVSVKEIFTTEQEIAVSSSRNIGIYFTVVSFVRLSEKVPENASIGELSGKYKSDVLVCNATYEFFIKYINFCGFPAFFDIFQRAKHRKKPHAREMDVPLRFVWIYELVHSA